MFIEPCASCLATVLHDGAFDVECVCVGILAVFAGRFCASVSRGAFGVTGL